MRSATPEYSCSMRLTRRPVRKLIDAMASSSRRMAARVDSTAAQRVRQRRTEIDSTRTANSAQAPSAAAAMSKTLMTLKFIRRTHRCVIWAAAAFRWIPACRRISTLCRDAGPGVAGLPCRLWRSADPRSAAPGKGLNCLSGQLRSLGDLAHGACGDSFAVGFSGSAGFSGSIDFT